MILLPRDHPQVNSNASAPKPYNYPPMAAPKSPSMAAPRSPSYPYQQPQAPPAWGQQQQQQGPPAWSQPQQQQQNNYNSATLPRSNAPNNAPAGQYYYYNWMWSTPSHSLVMSSSSIHSLHIVHDFNTKYYLLLRITYRPLQRIHVCNKCMTMFIVQEQTHNDCFELRQDNINYVTT